MSQQTVVDDWDEVGRLNEAAEAGVPSAIDQKRGGKEPAVAASKGSATKPITIDSDNGLSDGEVLTDEESEAGSKMATAWRYAAEVKKRDKELRTLFRLKDMRVRWKISALYERLDRNQRHGLPAAF